MSNQLEKVKELIALREQARLGGGDGIVNLWRLVRLFDDL